MSIFSERLKELREEKRVSMMALGKLVGASDASICKWENGDVEPKATYIRNLSVFFGVSADYLLGLENEFGSKTYEQATIPAKSTLSQDESALMQLFRTLPDGERAQALAYVEYLAEKRGAKTKKA